MRRKLKIKVRELRDEIKLVLLYAALAQLFTIPYTVAHTVTGSMGVLAALVTGISTGILATAGYAYMAASIWKHSLEKLIITSIRGLLILAAGVTLAVFLSDYGLGSLGIILVVAGYLDIAWSMARATGARYLATLGLLIAYSALMGIADRLSVILASHGVPVYLSLWSIKYAQQLAENKLFGGLSLAHLLLILTAGLLLRKLESGQPYTV